MKREHRQQLAVSKERFHQAVQDLVALVEEDGVPRGVVGKFRLSLEEWFANLLHHSGLGAEEEIELTLLVEEDALRLHVIDGGVAFDPLAFASPDLSLPVDEKPIGGLGVHLIKKLASSIGYQRVDGANHIEIRW